VVFVVSFPAVTTRSVSRMILNGKSANDFIVNPQLNPAILLSAGSSPISGSSLRGVRSKNPTSRFWFTQHRTHRGLPMGCTANFAHIGVSAHLCDKILKSKTIKKATAQCAKTPMIYGNQISHAHFLRPFLVTSDSPNNRRLHITRPTGSCVTSTAMARSPSSS